MQKKRSSAAVAAAGSSSSSSSSSSAAAPRGGVAASAAAAAPTPSAAAPAASTSSVPAFARPPASGPSSPALYAPGGALGPAPVSDPSLRPAGYALDDVLTPMERSVKTYLTSSVAKDLVECLALLAVERPPDPHLWLAQRILERGAQGSAYVVVRRALDPGRSKLKMARDVVEGMHDGPAYAPAPTFEPRDIGAQRGGGGGGGGGEAGAAGGGAADGGAAEGER